MERPDSAAMTKPIWVRFRNPIDRGGPPYWRLAEPEEIVTLALSGLILHEICVGDCHDGLRDNERLVGGRCACRGYDGAQYGYVRGSDYKAPVRYV